MSLKSAALFAFVALLILTAFLALGFINTILNVARGLVPAIQLLNAFVHLLAAVGLTVFFYIFQRTAR